MGDNGNHLFGKVTRLVKTSVNTIRIEGVKEFINKTKFYLKSRILKDDRMVYGDILFINGCTFLHPQR